MAVEIVTGITEKVFVKSQTFGTFVAMVATDATSPVKGSFKLEPFENFEKTKQARGTASLLDETELDRGGKWSGSFYVRPNTAGTPPDCGELIKAAMGVETGSVYTLSDTICNALQFMHVIDGHWAQFASGAWVEQMVINITGNGIPTVDFSGGFSRFGWVYRDDIKTNEATSQTSIQIDDASRGCVREPAMCEFEGNDNSAAGYIITASDNTASSANFTITPGIATAQVDAGKEILPFVLAQTLGGTILSATECALTIGALEPGFIDAKVTVDTGIGPRDKDATSQYPTAIARVAERSIETDMSFYFTDTAAGLSPFVGYAHDGSTHDIDLRVGADTASKRMKLSIPKGRLDITQPDTGEIITVSGKVIAQQSAAAGDEFAITFD